MSGREKIGLQSKSSNLKKDEKNLEEKKERDTSKTRSQVKGHKKIVRVSKITQDSSTADSDKTLCKNKVKQGVSRRKSSLPADKTIAIRRTRQTEDILELKTKLIKRSPTIIDKLISKNKSAIKKSQQNKRMPEKSVKDDEKDENNGTEEKSESISQPSRKPKNSSSSSACNVKRKKIDAAKLLTTTLARKKLKASQACIEMSAKKRLLRSNNLDLIGGKNSLFNLDQKRKLNNGVKILRRKTGSNDEGKRRILRKCKLGKGDDRLKRKDTNAEDKSGDEKNIAGPSNMDNSKQDVKDNNVHLKSKRGKVLQTINTLVRPLKKFPVNSAGFGVNRWKIGLQTSARGRGRGGRVFRGRGRGFLHRRMPYLTRSDSPVPLLRNGKRRNCDSTEEKVEGVKKRRRNISSEFSKSESLADDQMSFVTDSEFSFCDSSSVVTKVENLDFDDIKIKTEILSPDGKESCSDKIDANSNLFSANEDEKSDVNKLNSVKLIVDSPSELKIETSEVDTDVDETKGCDYKKDSKRKLSSNSLANSDLCSFPLDSKFPMKSCRRLSLDSKSDCNFEDSSDCDISGDKNLSKIQKSRKKTDISERKKISRSLWVRRSLRGVQKNTDSDDLSEILKLTDSDDSKMDSESSDIPCSLPSDDSHKLSDGRLKSSENDPAVDFCLQIEDSPLKNESLKDDSTFCKNCSNEEEARVVEKPIPKEEKKTVEPKIVKDEGEKEVELVFIREENVKKIEQNVFKEEVEIKTKKNDVNLKDETVVKDDPFKSCKIDSVSDFIDKKLVNVENLIKSDKNPFNLSVNIKESLKENDQKDDRLIDDKITPEESLLSNISTTTSKSEPDKNPEKVKILSVNKSVNNNIDIDEPVTKDNKSKMDINDDVFILNAADEIISIENDEVDDERGGDVARDLKDRRDDAIGIAFFKTKDLVEKEKIDQIIESLEVSDEVNDMADETKISANDSSVTVLNESIFSSTITKDILKNNSEIEVIEPSKITASNNEKNIQFSSETELNDKIVNIHDGLESCKNNDSSSFTTVLLDDSNSKDNLLANDKLTNPVDNKSLEDNSNFSEHSSSSSSYTSAVTELPTSVDSDALEMGDNLSSNDWNEKHYNNTDSSLNIENVNNVIDNDIKLKNEIKAFDGVGFESTNAHIKGECKREILISEVCSNSEQINSSGIVATADMAPGVSGVDVGSVKILTDEGNKIKETPEERANKESILSALGLQSLHTTCDEKSKKPESTGTLKAVIKLNRAGDKKSGGRKMFFKQYGLDGEKDTGGAGDMLEYRICSEADQSNENGQVQAAEDSICYRKTSMKQRTVSLDETSNSSISAFTWTTVEPQAATGDGSKDEKGAAVKQTNLVIPEKSSSFSIHPGRLCSDICSYCFGKFGSLDTPCHLAQLKNHERQQKILANEAHLKMDSCLCDGCYRYVDRKANCPQSVQRSKKQRRTLPNAVCSVQNCTQPAHHSIRRKWLVKLKKSISKKLDIDMDKHPHLPFPLCNQHYYWVDYFTVCGICKKRLTRNHMYALGAEANELNVVLKKDGIPVKLSDKLFLCKLCRYYSSLRLKYKETSGLNANHKLFLRSYKKKILAYLDIAVSESEEEAEKSSQEDEANSVPDSLKSKKRKSKQVGHEGKKRKMMDDKLESCESVENSDEPQMIDYSYLDTLQIKMGSNKKPSDRSCDNQKDSLEIDSIASLFNPLESRQSCSKDSEPKVKVDVKPTRIQVKFGNLNIGKLSNLNIGQDSRPGREKSKATTIRPPHLPGEKELPLVGELIQEDNLGRNGWEKYTLSLQFDRETKRLWNELQRPYGNQSSFLRHLVMLEKYWRSGSLVLADNADPRAVKYNQRAKNRVQAYESVSVRPSNSPLASSGASPLTSPVTSTVTVTSSLLATPIVTASTSLSSSLPSISCNLPTEIVQIVTPISSVSSATVTSRVSTSPSSSATVTPPPPPPPLLKLDNSVMWQKLNPNNQSPPFLTLQNSQFVRPIKVVVSSMSSSSSGKSVPNVISVLTNSSSSKTTASTKPIKMTLQQFQSFQKRCKKDIKITPAMNVALNKPIITLNNPLSLSSSSTTITASAALAAAKAVTTVTAATSTAISTLPKPSSTSADTFIPLICDVRSLAGTNMNWNRGLKTPKGSKVTYYTPILPKLPNTLTVRHIVPSSGTSVPLNSSVTIEKAPSDNSLMTTSLVPEKPSISVFREDCSDSSV